MKKRIGVITDSNVLYNKIRLLLIRDVETVLVKDKSGAEGCCTVLGDVSSPLSHEIPCILLGDGGALPLPFRHSELLALIGGNNEEEAIVLLDSKRGARVLGENIKLTELEHKLLCVLLSRDGFVSREELLQTVWDGECDDGIVNVYVYYLRKKIEKSGNKIIISSRNEGYKIDEKYRRKR